VRVAALAAITLGVAAGGIAYAAIPDTSGVIHACYAKRDGTLRVIDNSTTSCNTSKEQDLSWNEVGPQGPPGPGATTFDATVLPDAPTEVTLATVAGVTLLAQCSTNPEGGGAVFLTIRPSNPAEFVQLYGTSFRARAGTLDPVFLRSTEFDTFDTDGLDLHAILRAFALDAPAEKYVHLDLGAHFDNNRCTFSGMITPSQ
jgi:hypothetical protein